MHPHVKSYVMFIHIVQVNITPELHLGEVFGTSLNVELALGELLGKGTNFESEYFRKIFIALQLQKQNDLSQ